MHHFRPPLPQAGESRWQIGCLCLQTSCTTHHSLLQVGLKPGKDGATLLAENKKPPLFAAEKFPEDLGRTINRVGRPCNLRSDELGHKHIADVYLQLVAYIQ
jgi:hypothetical protein